MAKPVDALCRVLWRMMIVVEALETAVKEAKNDEERAARTTYYVAYSVAVAVMETVIAELQREEEPDDTCGYPGADVIH